MQAPIFVDILDMINYQIRYEMRLEQDPNILLNSAAIPLPTPANSAAGGDAPLADKYLKEQEFLETRRPFAGAEAGFLPAARERDRRRLVLRDCVHHHSQVPEDGHDARVAPAVASLVD